MIRRKLCFYEENLFPFDKYFLVCPKDHQMLNHAAGVIGRSVEGCQGESRKEKEWDITLPKSIFAYIVFWGLLPDLVRLFLLWLMQG